MQEPLSGLEEPGYATSDVSILSLTRTSTEHTITLQQNIC